MSEYVLYSTAAVDRKGLAESLEIERESNELVRVVGG